MPMYKYVCPNCGKVVEELKSVSKREEQIICPRCRSKMVRAIGDIGIKFKGDGFYSTESKR